MAVKAITYKNWCVENISPQCWPRLLLKSFNTLRDEGLQLNAVEEPAEDLVLSPALFEALNNALQEIYEIQIEEGVLE